MEQLSITSASLPEQIAGFRKSPPSKFSFFNIKVIALAILLSGSASTILSSVKWEIGIFAWIAPVCWLFFSRIMQFKRKWLWFFPIILVTNIITSYDVAPFPSVVLVILGILESLQFMIIYISDQWIYNKNKQFITTLFFPAASVTLEFINAHLGGGVWWSIANSQFNFKSLVQLSSVTGLWGISFLIYWFASVFTWALDMHFKGKTYKKALMIFLGLFTFIIIAGKLRYSLPEKNSRKIKIAGLSVPMMPYLENIYRDYCGKSISIDPRISISSARLQEINSAQVPFIENADTIHFINGYNALKRINDSLFILSQRAVEQGAKIIIWSEANAIIFKREEESFIARGREFTKKNGVYLLMAVAAIRPGKIVLGSKFLENQAIFIGPDGQVLNVFHKNNPVPVAEASTPGDGIIPVLQTPYGRISTSICYDADFPGQMRQLSKNQADLLLLPSGDWFAIAPYHTYMAMFRAVENGTSVVRQASGGLSAAGDYTGRIATSLDFFKSSEKLWVAEIPVGYHRTIYGQIGDLFAYLCIGLALGGLIFGWTNRKESTRIDD